MSRSDAQHILLTADAVGGVWQYATDLSAQLNARGHFVTLALLGPPPDREQRSVTEQIERLRLVETGLPLDWLCDGPAPVIDAAQQIAQLARSEEVDLIHCNMPTLVGAASYPAPVLAVTHGCVATWWQAAKAEPLASSYRWHRDMMRRGLAAADRVVATSAAFAATIKQTYRLPRMPLTVHNGRPPARVSRRQVKPRDFALTIGRMWDSVKNGEMLDRVAGAIDMPFVAAGALRGPHGEQVSLTRLDTRGQIGAAAVEALLAERPVFVSAARFEPFGLAVLEAASAGCALVLSDIPTFRELWDGCAIFVDPADEKGFAVAINRLHRQPDLRQRLGDKAARHSLRYTPAASADAIEAIYGQMLSRQEAAA